MTARRSSFLDRCNSCRVNYRYCFCSKIKKIDIQTHLQVFIHKKELALTSNTISLTKLSVPANKIEIQVRGDLDSPLNFSFLQNQDYEYLYLFPTDDAEVLTTELVNEISKPICLLIPDGTWRQASRIHKRELPLKTIRAIKVQHEGASLYQLRKQKFQHGLCTHEAVAHVLGIIEGKEVEQSLLENLKIMVEANLKARAQLI